MVPFLPVHGHGPAKKRLSREYWIKTERPLGCLGNDSRWFYNVPGFYAPCACPNSDRLSISDTFHALKIGVPAFFGFVMGMAYTVPYDRFLATNITYSRHGRTPLIWKF